MSSTVFLLGEEKNDLVMLPEKGYVTEDQLQLYLAKYPELLPGDQIDPDRPRRWLLVRREMPVFGSQNQNRDWSLDHLFLDQDARPTFVECKRSKNPEVRRKVVAQMIEYAANGSRYWNIDDIKDAAENEAGGEIELEKKLEKLLDEDSNEDDQIDLYKFWEAVKHNLEKKKLRLIFVADSIPIELRNMIEFLNEKMVDVEVLGVEIKQFQHMNADQKVLVPRVIGFSESARIRKGMKSKTTEKQFIHNCSQPSRDFFSYCLSKAKSLNHQIYWGEKGFSLKIYSPVLDKKITYVQGYPDGSRFEGFWIIFNNGVSDIENYTEISEKILQTQLFESFETNNLKSLISVDNIEKLKKVFDLLVEELKGFV